MRSLHALSAAVLLGSAAAGAQAQVSYEFLSEAFIGPTLTYTVSAKVTVPRYLTEATVFGTGDIDCSIVPTYAPGPEAFCVSLAFTPLPDFDILDVDLTLGGVPDISGAAGLFPLEALNTNGTYAADLPPSALRVSGQPIPEPATWAMLILGFGLVGQAMRARRRAPEALSA
jgi:hypothetical protein